MEVTGRVLDLKGLINYQDGSVVSREIINRDGGTVTLFAFAGGQGLSEHTAPYDALVHILDGKAEIAISGQHHSLKVGDAIIMPGGRPHSLKAPENFKMLLVMIR